MPTPGEQLALLEAENEQLNAHVAQLNEQLVVLEEARDRYANLYDFVCVPCLTLDQAGAITELNQRTVSLLRYERLRLLGAPLMTLVAREHRRNFLEHLVICKRGIDAVTFEVMLTPSEGAPIPVRLTVRCNQYQGHGYTVAVADMRAIQNARAEQQRLIVAEREVRVESQVKSRLIADMNIDLRGLLSAVLRTGNIVRNREDLGAEMREPLAKLLDHVSSLRQRVLHFSSTRIRPRASARRARESSRPRGQRFRAVK